MPDSRAAQDVALVTGWALREASKIDRPRLLRFLDHHAATMPRPTFRYAIEHFDKKQLEHYLGLKKAMVNPV